LLDVFGLDGGAPFAQRTRGDFEFGFGGHIAPAQGGVGECFRHEGAATLRRGDEVFASLAGGIAFSSDGGVDE
jgi:hypothetical protein